MGHPYLPQDDQRQGGRDGLVFLHRVPVARAPRRGQQKSDGLLRQEVQGPQPQGHAF